MAHGRITAEARAQFESLPLGIKARVARVFDRLAARPDVSGPKPLRGELAGQFRVRTGDHRVQFAASGRNESATVVVVRMGHRDGFYE